ncbi:hypothetical protein [Streptomyces sp. NPDC007205]|uniref:hypothetical protein n=1 Tax=Streptomyces sp. NPDC007205 TaxID=3154316 RepID=UPI0033D73041
MSATRRSARTLPFDLADRAATAHALDAVLRGGAVDAVVNNVGIVRPAPLPAVGLDVLQAVYDLRVRTAAQLTGGRVRRRGGHRRFGCSRADRNRAVP